MLSFSDYDCHRYFAKGANSLKYKFNNLNLIKNNYSQAFQDMFVLSMLDGKKDGIYIEIGGDDPIVINNTYLLESEYGWKGISFEIESEKVNHYNSIRKNNCICANAITADYSKIFKDNNFSTQIDYLQLDIDPAEQTLACLKNLPLDTYRFSVITYETDAYRSSSQLVEESRSIFKDYGYELIAKDVLNCGHPFEDWYVDPNVIDKNLVEIFKTECSLSGISVVSNV
jgi:hypothetical protein